MPRTSETDSDRTTPGHNPAKKRKSSYSKEADNLHNCPLNLRIDNNCLLCGNAKRSPEESANSQAPKGEEVSKGKKTYQDCGAAIKPAVEENFRRERKGPSHLVKSTAKVKAETKKMVSAQIQTSPVPAPAKETQPPRRERKESVTQAPPMKTPVTVKEGDYSQSGYQLVLMMQTFATALAAQLNITMHTEQVKKAIRTTLGAAKFLIRTSEDKMRRQNKMSISLDADMSTSMEIIDP